jgi:hypothetical protein
MTTSKSNGAYDTLISLRDKLTRLNGVITPEAVDKLEDELGVIFTVTKTHHYIYKARSTVTSPARSPSQNTDSSLVTRHGHTVYRPTPERTPRQR